MIREKRKVIVVGGGASGMMAAISAARQGNKVIVLEQKESLGKKILVTGNGRCNFTNRIQQPLEAWYRTEREGFPKFALEQFTWEDTLMFFSELGMQIKEKNGYFYPEGLSPAKHPFYYAGLYYLQEPSAMTPASLLPVSPGDFVLDLCAAPGGKSTELAAKLCGSGILVANDISNSRAKALLKNIELFGVKNAVVLSEAPGKLSERFGGFFGPVIFSWKQGHRLEEPSVELCPPRIEWVSPPLTELAWVRGVSPNPVL